MTEQVLSARALASTARWTAAARGWQATLSQAGQPDANHGRWTFPVIPTAMPDMPQHNWYVTAQRAA